MNSHPEYIDDLIVKVLSNTATQAENISLIDWRTQSEENERYYAEMLFIFEKAGKLAPKTNVNIDNAWKKVQKEIHQSEAKIVPIYPKSAPKKWLVWSAAAALVLVSTFAFIYQNTKTKSEYISISQEKHFNLTDGSTAILNPNSTLKLVEGTNREYILTGEAEFKVKHDAKNPFIIHTDFALIKDLGTIFNVKYIPHNDTICVSVTEGLVQFYSPTDDGIQLTMGESGYYLKSSKKFYKLVSTDCTTTRQSFIFEDQTLENIVLELNNKFDAKIKIETPAIKNCKINASFPNASKEEILEIITETLGLWKIEKNGEIILGGKGCNH
ncbi:MAG: FecR domain-containing protein [Cytophagales bacterium]